MQDIKFSATEYYIEDILLCGDSPLKHLVSNILGLQNDRRNQEHDENQNGQSLHVRVPLRKQKAIRRRETQKDDSGRERHSQRRV